MAFNPRGNGDDDQVLGDINVTPLVDVMLVLLIIFMVAAPMLHQGIDVALPRSQAKALPVKVEDPLVVSINRDGLVYIQETPVAAADLVERLKATIARRHDDTVFLKGDRDAAYGKIIDVLDILQRGGIQHVGMVTERPPKGRGH
jgi:biopolymer transport protein TolR